MNEKIQKIYEDYGQLHEEGCEINDEGGSFDGCSCAVKTMAEEIVSLMENEVLKSGTVQALAERERVIGILDKLNLGGQLDGIIEEIQNV